MNNERRILLKGIVAIYKKIVKKYPDDSVYYQKRIREIEGELNAR